MSIKGIKHKETNKQYNIKLENKHKFRGTPVILPTVDNTYFIYEPGICECLECMKNPKNDSKHQLQIQFRHVNADWKIISQFVCNPYLFQMISDSEVLLIYSDNQKQYAIIFWNLKTRKIHQNILKKQENVKSVKANYFYDTQLISLIEIIQVQDKWVSTNITYLFRYKQSSNLGQLKKMSIPNNQNSTFKCILKINNSQSFMIIKITEQGETKLVVYNKDESKQLNIKQNIIYSWVDSQNIRDVWELKQGIFYVSTEIQNFIWDQNIKFAIDMTPQLKIARNIQFMGHFHQFDRLTNNLPLMSVDQFYPVYFLNPNNRQIIHIIEQPPIQEQNGHVGILEYQKSTYLQRFFEKNEADYTDLYLNIKKIQKLQSHQLR